jgi:hypothetical protein
MKVEIHPLGAYFEKKNDNKENEMMIELNNARSMLDLTMTRWVVLKINPCILCLHPLF